MPPRPLPVRVGWALRDYAKRVWDNSGEDNVFFLAGGIAFNILLAAVPFFLLLASGLTYFFDQSPDVSGYEIGVLIDRLLPPHPEGPDSPIHAIINDIVRARGAVSVYSAIGFVWFSTRLFGSLRTVLAEVFDIENDRGIVDGKIFDIKITIVSTMLVVAYTALNAYLAIATTRGIKLLTDAGLRQETMGAVEYGFGRLIALAVMLFMFFSLYKFLPKRRVRWQTALIAASFTALLFEGARNAFTSYVASFDPGSLYTGTLAVLVILVLWVYYAALIFILGGEVAQVYDLRRVRRMQREALDADGPDPLEPAAG